MCVASLWRQPIGDNQLGTVPPPIWGRTSKEPDGDSHQSSPVQRPRVERSPAPQLEQTTRDTQFGRHPFGVNSLGRRTSGSQLEEDCGRKALRGRLGRSKSSAIKTASCSKHSSKKNLQCFFSLIQSQQVSRLPMGFGGEFYLQTPSSMTLRVAGSF